MKPLTGWSFRFYLRHPIRMARYRWEHRGQVYPKVTVGELLPLVEQLKDALDERISRSEASGGR